MNLTLSSFGSESEHLLNEIIQSILMDCKDINFHKEKNIALGAVETLIISIGGSVISHILIKILDKLCFKKNTRDHFVIKIVIERTNHIFLIPKDKDKLIEYLKESSDDEQEILNNERNSFTRYCIYIGIEPNVLAQAWLYKKGKNIDAMNRRILSFSDKLPTFNINIENKNSYIDQIINMHRQFAHENAEILCDHIISFDKANPEIIKWEILNKFHVRFDKKKFIQEIPIEIAYDDFGYNVYVNSKKINYCKALEILIDGALIPLIINSICTIDKKRQLNVLFHSPDDVIAVSDGLIALAKFINGDSTALNSIDNSLLGHRDNYILFGLPFYRGVIEFLFLHEYSHVLLDHISQKSNKVNEANADILAYNILLSSFASGNIPLYFEGSEALITFKALGPIVLFFLYSLVDCLNGLKEQDIHPQSFHRQQYLLMIGLQIFEIDSVRFKTFVEIYDIMKSIFNTAINRLSYDKADFDAMDLRYFREVNYFFKR